MLTQAITLMSILSLSRAQSFIDGFNVIDINCNSNGANFVDGEHRPDIGSGLLIMNLGLNEETTITWNASRSGRTAYGTPGVVDIGIAIYFNDGTGNVVSDNDFSGDPQDQLVNEEFVMEVTLLAGSYNLTFEGSNTEGIEGYEFSNTLSCLVATTEPTMEPTGSPTSSPTVEPTMEPTPMPTGSPTSSLTVEPTMEPTTNPTGLPTTDPTNVPTSMPTTDPTNVPTSMPTTDPTNMPTTDPTNVPTSMPTTDPTGLPTLDPTPTPTDSPTVPTSSPTSGPTVEPTTNPTGAPTVQVTDAPTMGTPTMEPTTSDVVTTTCICDDSSSSDRDSDSDSGDSDSDSASSDSISSDSDSDSDSGSDSSDSEDCICDDSGSSSSDSDSDSESSDSDSDDDATTTASPTASPTTTLAPTASPTTTADDTTTEEADSDSDSDSGSDSDSDSDSSDGTNDVISQSNFLRARRNRGVDVGGDDVTIDSDFDSVENAQTDSFEATDAALTVLDDDAEINAFGAEIFAESGAEGDLVSAGLDGDAEDEEGVYHLEVSLSHTVLISLWAGVVLAMCCVSACCYFQYGKKGVAGRFQD